MAYSRGLLVVILLAAVVATSCLKLAKEPLRYEPPPPPPGLARDDIITSWIEQPLDHFDPQNNETWLMRYMSNDEWFTGAGYPIFIMVGGEWTISQGYLQTGNMFDTARLTGAYLFYTEHRYYGESKPVADLSTPNLKYLSVDQALADLAYFIAHLKERPEFADSEVVLWGGSYAANMVVWFAGRYGHLMDVGVASSAPILAKAHFNEYLEVVHSTFLHEGGQRCIDVFTEAVQEMRSNMETEEGRQRNAELFNQCEPIIPWQSLERQYFYGRVTWTLSGLVQYASPGAIADTCSQLLEWIPTDATPLERLAGYISGVPDPDSCSRYTYADYIHDMNNTMYEDATSRLWTYQTCTEYGYFQISPTSKTMLDGLITYDFYADICQQIYGEEFDGNLVETSAERTNILNGGLEPSIARVVSVHGLQDPWHALGARAALSSTAPVVLVPGASHCFDLSSGGSNDNLFMQEARLRVQQFVVTTLRENVY